MSTKFNPEPNFFFITTLTLFDAQKQSYWPKSNHFGPNEQGASCLFINFTNCYPLHLILRAKSYLRCDEVAPPMPATYCHSLLPPSPPTISNNAITPPSPPVVTHSRSVKHRYIPCFQTLKESSSHYILIYLQVFVIILVMTYDYMIKTNASMQFLLCLEML